MTATSDHVRQKSVVTVSTGMSERTARIYHYHTKTTLTTLPLVTLFQSDWWCRCRFGTECKRRKRSETKRQSHTHDLGLCLVLYRRKKSQWQRLPSLTVISVTRCKRSRPLYDRPDVCSTFVRCDTNVVWTVRRGPPL